MKHTALIIEDEIFLAQQLNNLLNQYCPEITVLEIVHSGKEAEEKIISLKPDLIFIDIELPDMNAFDLLKKLKHCKFSIIFTTAFDQYALQAFDHNVIHYLLKPLTKESLLRAVQKYISGIQHPKDITEVLNVMKKIQQREKKIRLPKLGGFVLLPIADIIRLEAEGRYTRVYLVNSPDVKNKSYEIVCVNIKEFEEQLQDYHFFRCHHSHIVNLKNVKSYQKGEGGVIELNNGETIPVSKNKKEFLLSQLLEL